MTRWIGFIEITRRCVLVAAIIAAITACFWTRFEPYIMVSPHEPPHISEAANPIGPPRDGRPSLIAGPRSPVNLSVVTVQGEAWEPLFSGVMRSFSENRPIGGWEHRLQKKELKRALKENQKRSAMTEEAHKDEAERVQRLKAQYGIDVSFRGSFPYLYFLAREAPFAGTAAGWVAGSSYILQLAGRPERRIKITYLPAYRLAGFFDVITLPEAFSYPFRSMSLWFALAGCVLYLALPWTRPGPDVVAYRRWRVMLMDLLTGVILFAVFFGLPIAIVGGTRELLTRFLFFAIPFWLIAVTGLFGLSWAAWSASYRLSILQEGIEISGLMSHRFLPYSSIQMVQPVRLRPPRWLIVLSWLAITLSGSPEGVAGQTGRALILSSSASNGLRLDLADGHKVYVWYSDQMGSQAMEHFAGLYRALRRAGTGWAERTQEIRKILPPLSS